MRTPPSSALRRAARPMAWTMAIVIGTVLGAASAGAQIRGVVVDGAQRPVEEATVELWLAERPVARMLTDEQGRFQIPGGPAEGMLMLTIRRMGLAAQAIPLASRDTTLRVTMEAQTLSLRPIAVEASAGRLCPRREEPEARALWTAMRGRYWQSDQPEVPLFGFIEFRSGVGEKSDAFDPAAGRTGPMWTRGPLIIAYPELMVRSGYATRAQGGVGERTAFWDYRALDGGTTQDFTGDFFGQAHTFSILRRTAEETTIAFCPRERMGRTGQVQGTLVVLADTTLGSARWTFRTPAPDEDAGGEASFHRPDPTFGGALLARESVFWRKTGRHRYYYEAQRFTAWRPRGLDEGIPPEMRPYVDRP